MQLDKVETIKNYIIKAKETVIDAEIAIANSRLENAQNRIYYSIFNIVTALAYLYDFITSKHQILMGWFNKKFIYEDKIFSQDLYAIYKEAFANRQGADYGIYFNFSKEEVIKNFDNAKFFIQTLEKNILEKLLQGIFHNHNYLIVFINSLSLVKILFTSFDITVFFSRAKFIKNS